MKALIAAVALVIAGASAQASDMTAPRAYTPDTGNILPTSSFAGAYVGASVNWNRLGGENGAGLDWDNCEKCDARTLRRFFETESNSTDLAFPDLKSDQIGAGFRAGYNWQVGRIYGGPLVMVDFGGMSSSTSIGDENAGGSVDFNVNIQGTVAGKLGVAITDRIGFYGLAGWTFADVDVDTEAHIGTGEGAIKSSNNHSKYVNGFAYGGGAEFKITKNLTGFAEYQHVNLSDFDASGTLFDCVKYDYNAQPDLDTVRVGLTYTFD